MKREDTLTHLPGGRTVHNRPDTLRATLARGFELLRNGATGAFIAAPTPDYYACWMRDQLYTALAHLYLREHQRFVQSVHVVFDCLEQSIDKIKRAVHDPPRAAHEFIHAKFHPVTLRECTNEWGHHQVDAVGLFLFTVGAAHQQGIDIVQTADDRKLIELLPQYLAVVRYAEIGDFGMWEEGEKEDHARLGAPTLRTSSVGAALAGLIAVRDAGLARVPNALIDNGRKTLERLLPIETAYRDTDMAQLSLIWPYRIVTAEMRDRILRRVQAKLVQEWGLNRYWGDEYGGRSSNGISAEWPLGFFWLSIIASDAGESEQARRWFERGMRSMTPEGYLPEFIVNGKPNAHTPLAWTHAFAVIAHIALES